VPVKTAEAIEKILTHTKSGVNYEVSVTLLRSLPPCLLCPCNVGRRVPG